jgi:hypothetical protein
MRRGRRTFASLGVLFAFLACEGDQRSGAARQTADTAAASTDTTAAITDTGAGLQTRRDSVAPVRARDSAPATPAPTAAAPKPVAPKPAAPKPATPKPTPSPAPEPAAAPADTATAAAIPPETTQTASMPGTEASAPLRDQYHQAPRDTVTPEVYDGWKQFNLNCARCHGEDVLGTTIAPHLITSVRPGGTVATKAAFDETVCKGRPEKGMPAWCPLGLDMDKINAIYLYVKGRSEGKIAPGRPARRE